MKHGLTLLVVALVSALSGFGIGYEMKLARIQANALDAAVRAECGKDVPVTAIWHQDYDQVIYHFRPTPTQWKDRWCKGEKP